MQIEKNPNQNEAAAWLGQLRDYLPLLYIWGCFDIAIAAIEIFWVWTFPEWLPPILFIAGLILTLAVILRARQASPARKNESSRMDLRKWAAGLVACALIVWLFPYFRLLDPLTASVARSLVLAGIYTLGGIYLERRFLYLGIWLFALTAFIHFAYLGFAPVVLGLFGGLSLVACGRILRLGLTR